MTAGFKRLWTETDLRALIGQSESIRREFKAGVMFEREPESKWVETLSKEVSALANTEGGEIILGIDEEKRSRPRVAKDLDGVPANIAPERLQQLVEGNVSPYLPGMRVQRIKLSQHPDRVAFVIQVPQGSTAYQANDGRYYGRSEFEAKYLPDHEVRLRMMRGQNAQVRVEVRAIERVDYAVSIYKFHTVMHNVGQVTVRTCALSFEFQRNKERSLAGEGTSGPIVSGKEIRFLFGGNSDDDRVPLFPGDSIVYPIVEWSVFLPLEAYLGDTGLECRWKVYLDDAPPSSGTINVAQLDFPRAHGDLA